MPHITSLREHCLSRLKCPVSTTLPTHYFQFVPHFLNIDGAGGLGAMKTECIMVLTVQPQARGEARVVPRCSIKPYRGTR